MSKPVYLIRVKYWKDYYVGLFKYFNKDNCNSKNEHKKMAKNFFFVILLLEHKCMDICQKFICLQIDLTIKS